MQTIKTLLTMKHNNIPDQQVSDALKMAKGSVNAFYNRFKASGLNWPLPADISDSQLRDIIYPQKTSVPTREQPDWAKLGNELTRPGMTLQLLWEEYSAENSTGLGRTAFYDGFKSHRKDSEISMTIIHKGGEKVYVDYSGDGLSYVNRDTGEVISVQVFVSAWGASGYAFVDVTHTQSKEDWAKSHVRSFEFFGCLPHVLVPDNLKAGVIKPDLYEPTLNPLYAKMAEHYGISVLPARVRRPQDKATVESCVLQVQRRILAPLRDQSFFSIDEIRQTILEALESFNSRPMKDHGNQSRRERFEQQDMPHARPITQEHFAICALRTGVLVQKNYHIEFDHYHYSVPCALVGKRVDVHQVNGIIEIYLDGVHVCRHPKRPATHGYETNKEHMPATHAYAKGLSPAWLILKGGEVGPNTSSVVKRALESRKHPEQAFKAAQGIIALERKYGKERLENACVRALYHNCCEYRAVKSILEKNLDAENLPDEIERDTSNIHHTNVRGASYYSQSKIHGGV